MGGEYEAKVSSAKPSTDGDKIKSDVAFSGSFYPHGNVPATQELRFHKNGNEIHFHDDANKLKCVVPLAEWFIIARNLKRLVGSTYLDTQNKTVLSMKPTCTVNDQIELKISVGKVELSPTYAALEKFSNQLGI